MAYELRLPDLGEGVAEGEVAAWLVSVGQQVAEDDPIVEVETDKATVEIPSPVDGVVAALHAQTGERVAVGGLLLTLQTEAAVGAADTPAPAVKATPGARQAAKQLGIEIAAVAGSGPAGAVTERDVRATASAREGGALQGRREPLRGVRRVIAERLTRSHREVPQVTVVEECDFTALAARRGERSHVAFVIEAVVSGLRAFPEFNATLDGEDIVYLDRYHVGVAAQGPKGLVVPVVRDAGAKTIDQLDEEVARLGQGARDDTLAPEQLRGGTFTVTLAGKLGGYFATPLVNLGQAAILGVHRISPRPVVRDGEIVVRDIGLVSCSFDHRIADGARATMFLLHVIDELQRA